MAIYFYKSSQFEKLLSGLEQHLFDSVFDIEQDTALAIASVERLASSIERLMDTLEQMYKTPLPEDTHGEKSFPIYEGRYRVFYKVSIRPNNGFNITFIDIDHNKQSNLDRFPEHSLIKFEDES